MNRTLCEATNTRSNRTLREATRVLDGEVTSQGDGVTRLRAAGPSIAAFPSSPTTHCSQDGPFRFPAL